MANALGEFVEASKILAMNPALLVVHFLLVGMMMREDFPDVAGPNSFCRQHPLASYVGTMVVCFGGSILGNFSMGESVLMPFADHYHLAMATVCWYLIHFSPRDIVFTFCKQLPSKMFIVVAKEFHRVLAVQHGVNVGFAKHPEADVVIICYSVVRGAGGMHMRIVQRLICGVWSPSSMEFMKPTLTTKTTFVASVVFLLDKKEMLYFSHDMVYFTVLVFFVVSKLSYFLQHCDVLVSVEKAICYIFCGGLFDDIERLIEEYCMSSDGQQQDQKEN